MTKESISLDFRLEEIDETRNYFLDEIKHNELMSKKLLKLCRALNYFENFLIFISAIHECISTYPFVSLVGVLVGKYKYLCNHCRN